MSRIREKTISFRVSEKEYRMMKNLIEQSGISNTDFLIKVCSNSVIYPTEELQSMKIEIGKIGNLLKKYLMDFQRANISKSDLENALQRIDEIWEKVQLLEK